MEEKQDRNRFAIGYTDLSEDVLVIFVPLRSYSEDLDGTALLRGKLDEAKSICLLRIQEMRSKRATAGLIKPMNCTPLQVA
jgi:hypothetical protein